MSTELSLGRRVRWAASIMATLVAAFVLVISAFVVDRTVRSEARDAASSRASVFIEEIDGQVLAGKPLGVPELMADVREFTHGGVLVAVFDPEGFVVGSKSVPNRLSDGCGEMSLGENDWLVCRSSATRSNFRVLVGQPMNEVLAHRKPLFQAGLLALFLAALGGALAGRLVERWALGPFRTFRSSLGHLGATNDAASWRVDNTGLVELDEIVAALNELLARLSVELTRARNFAGSAAHELRTPLARIKARLELLAEQENSEISAQLSGHAVPAVDDLIALVEHLLLLALPGEALKGATLVSLAAIAEESREALPLEQRARVTLALETDGHLVGDERVLRAMVDNALSNALKFSGGVVTLALVDGQGRVQLTVRDQGPGLSVEARERAFEPFYRAAEHRARAGHGIGLALIAHVVAAHGGHARFLDGPGAQLQVELPSHALA